MSTRYQWKAGRSYPVSAQDFGEWIESLPDCRPETIVERASDPRCIAHALFLWDESRAAYEHRLTQARVLYGTLTVTVVKYQRGKRTVHRVKAIMRTSRSGDYDPVEVAFREPSKRNFVLAQALAQLRALRRRYVQLSELATVFAALDKVERTIKRRA